MRIPAHDTDAELQRNAEASAAAVDAIVREVTKQLFVDSATAYVTGEAARTEALHASIRSAVSQRLPVLNETFLGVLNSFIGAAQEADPAAQADGDVAGVLQAIKAEVLIQLAAHLPPELRVIEKALQASGADERLAVLCEHTRGAADPCCDPASIALTASRMVEDLEGEAGANEVADRRLLAVLCLLREEARQLADEAEMGPSRGMRRGAGTNDGGVVVPEIMDVDVEEEEESSSNAGSSASPYTALRSVPAREVSFAKELMGVGTSERRRALLEAAFRGDTASLGSAVGLVRPGAFMDCVKALQAEMNGPQYQDSSAATLMRLEDIWRDAVLVLTDIACDGAAYYSP